MVSEIIRRSIKTLPRTYLKMVKKPGLNRVRKIHMSLWSTYCLSRTLGRTSSLKGRVSVIKVLLTAANT